MFTKIWFHIVRIFTGFIMNQLELVTGSTHTSYTKNYDTPYKYLKNLSSYSFFCAENYFEKQEWTQNKNAETENVVLNKSCKATTLFHLAAPRHCLEVSALFLLAIEPKTGLTGTIFRPLVTQNPNTRKCKSFKKMAVGR